MQDALNFYCYHLWANNRVFDHLQGLPEGIDQRGVPSVFPTISAVLAHMHSVDAMWLSVMRGDSFEKTLELVKQLRKENMEKGLNELREFFENTKACFLDFFEVQEDLDHLITVEHPQYGKSKTPLSELIRHVVNHGTYHRGNITAMLRQLGYPGVPTDYVIYLFDHGGTF